MTNISNKNIISASLIAINIKHLKVEQKKDSKFLRICCLPLHKVQSNGFMA